MLDIDAHRLSRCQRDRDKIAPARKADVWNRLDGRRDPRRVVPAGRRGEYERLWPGVHGASSGRSQQRMGDDEPFAVALKAEACGALALFRIHERHERLAHMQTRDIGDDDMRSLLVSAA
ncbi:MAG TPA: hypothetical protein VEU47_18175 [Candidatus Cybelea sp.]|nr:hypothetical protein [Candidatus Cybelea sp.]